MENITNYERYIRHIANKYKHTNHDIDDLIQEGYLGILKALQKFDPNNGASFLTYADKYIRYYINDYCFKNFNNFRIEHSTENKKILNKLLKYNIINDGKVNFQELTKISEKYSINMDKLIHMTKYISSSCQLVIESDHGDIFLPDLVQESTNNSIENFLEGLDKRNIYDNLLTTIKPLLDERELDIICSRWLSDKQATYKSLGEKYNCSGSRIEQVEKRAFKKIKKHLTNIEEYI